MKETDIKILRILQNDSKTKYQVIAEELGISTSTVHFRINKMIEDGTIKGFSAIVDPKKIGYETRTWLGLSVNAPDLKKVAKILASYDETQLVSTASGSHDIMVGVIAKNENELWEFINTKIKTINSVKSEIHVSSFLDIYKDQCHKFLESLQKNES